MDDAFDLGRFLNAQTGVYPQVLAELRAGQNRSHWIWFIFPQMKGLGSSSHAQFYGIGSLEEGKLADLIMLEKNLFDVPKDKLSEVKIQMTMMNGRVVYGGEL